MGVLAVAAALAGPMGSVARPVVFNLAVRHPEAAALAQAFADGVRRMDERARRDVPRLERWDARPPVLTAEVTVVADPRTGRVSVRCHPADAGLVAGWVEAFDRTYDRLRASGPDER